MRPGFRLRRCRRNIFAIKDGKIYAGSSAGRSTASPRSTVFHIAADLGLEIKEKRITRDELYICDERLFFTGTAAEVTPDS